MSGSALRRLVAALVLMGVLGTGLAQPWPRPQAGPNGLRGYVNSAGVFVIEPRFDSASLFESSGKARVRVGGKYGFIDQAGQVVVPPAFDDIVGGYRDDAPLLVASMVPGAEVKYMFVDGRGQPVTGEPFGWATVFRHGLAHVAEYGPGAPGLRASRHGFVDVQGKLVIPYRFEDARSFGPGAMAAARMNGKWGFIDLRGEWVIAPQFDEVPAGPGSVFDDHALARVRVGRHWILIDARGQRVGPAEWDFIGDFDKNGLAIVGRKLTLGDRKAGIINTRGDYVFAPQFDQVLPYANGYAGVMVAGRWGYIDTLGNIAVPPRYRLYGTDFNRAGTARVTLDPPPAARGSAAQGDDVYINTVGEIVLRPSAYSQVIAYNDAGFAVVRRDGKSGYVDNQGREGVGWFDDARSFSPTVGLAPVRQGALWGYVDASGRFVVPPTFDHAYTFGESDTAIVRLGGKWGHLGASGELVTPLKFDHLGPLNSDGLARAVVDGRHGYVDRDKNFVPLP